MRFNRFQAEPVSFTARREPGSRRHIPCSVAVMIAWLFVVAVTSVYPQVFAAPVHTITDVQSQSALAIQAQDCGHCHAMEWPLVPTSGCIK